MNDAGAAVTAIVPTYNSGEILDRCLDALAGADGVAETIVLDGGSTDGSDKRAGEREGVRVLRLPGTSLQDRLNRGMEMAAGDFGLLLNSDAFVDPATPATLASRLSEQGSAGAVGACLRYEDGSAQKSGGHYKTIGRLTLKALGIPMPERTPVAEHSAPSGATAVTWLPYCCAAVRRDAWRQVGGFDSRFDFYFEDVDFSRSLSEAGWTLEVFWPATAVHLGGGSTKSKDPSGWFLRYHRNAAIYFRKWNPRGWWVYAAVWRLRAVAGAGLWRVRGLLRRLRHDTQGASVARAWARAFSAIARS